MDYYTIRQNNFDDTYQRRGIDTIKSIKESGYLSIQALSSKLR